MNKAYLPNPRVRFIVSAVIPVSFFYGQNRTRKSGDETDIDQNHVKTADTPGGGGGADSGDSGIRSTLEILQGALRQVRIVSDSLGPTGIRQSF